MKKKCAPKSVWWSVGDRNSSTLNRGDFPGIAPELIKIDVLVIGVQLEKLKLEMLNSGPNRAPGGPSVVPGRPGGPFSVPRGDLEGKGDDSGGSGEKMARDVFFEIPERQIHIFTTFRACQLCKFHVVLSGRWAFLREAWAPPGGPK